MATQDQAQAVYAAEDLWSHKDWNANVKFGDWHEIQPFYVTLAKRFRERGQEIYPPTVRPRKGALKAHYDAALKSVFIPPYDRGGVWALNTGTAIHEFAHHLTPGCGHGPEFREAMAECLEVMGWEDSRTLLIQCYEEAGLSLDSRTEGISDKVQKLLTHADKAGTPEEQKTYLEKAESLAAENSINLALLRKRQADADPDAERERPTTGGMFSLRALPNTTYRNLAVELGTAIARAHGARCTIRGKSDWLTFYGFQEDIFLTELMISRVTPMMFDASDTYLKSPEHKATGIAATSARITFCKNFAWEVGRRLKEAVEQTEEKVQETLEIGSTSTALALREKEIEVADYVAHEFKRQGVKGSWSGSRTSNYHGGAAMAGTRSAQQANLFGRKELG